MTFVFLGIDQRDAQAVAMRRREEFRGKSVRLVGLRHLSALRGLAVSGWEASDRAKAHPNYDRACEALRASARKENEKSD